MNETKISRSRLPLVVVAMAALGSSISDSAQSLTLDASKLPRIGTVDERYQSYNIEMTEVTGGRFWKPYDNSLQSAPPLSEQSTGGMAPSLFEYRAPIDLAQPRLRKLAAALGPAYVRVSGTGANSVFFQDSDGPPPAAPPDGFRSVLTRAEWKGVVEFARATDAKLVTSFAISPGTRDANGVWTPAQAESLLQFTKSMGSSIAAAEFMNEPTMPDIGAAPKGYAAEAFARDVRLFSDFARREAPGMLVLGPGGVGEGSHILPPTRILSSEAVLRAAGAYFDAFSFHTYSAASSRCGGMADVFTASAATALSDAFLARGDESEQFYAALRDSFAAGKPLWLTETAEAACGGDRWASTFLDTFRYLNQLGDLAIRGVQVHMHNTLAASDYGLLDEKTLEPRPDYWAALIWRRFMGSTVLDAGSVIAPGLHVYAHCQRERHGGVSLLVINASTTESRSILLTAAGEQYTLTAIDGLDGRRAALNGEPLRLGREDALPIFRPGRTPRGEVTFAPASISFFEISHAKNSNCM